MNLRCMNPTVPVWKHHAGVRPLSVLGVAPNGRPIRIVDKDEPLVTQVLPP